MEAKGNPDQKITLRDFRKRHIEMVARTRTINGAQSKRTARQIRNLFNKEFGGYGTQPTVASVTLPGYLPNR